MVKIYKILILVLIIGIAFISDSNNKGAAQLELPIFVKEEKDLKAPRPLYVSDVIIVKFKSGINENSIKGLEQAQGVLEKHISPFGKFRVLKIPQGKSVTEMVEIFKKNPLVEYAEPNYYAYASMIPNDLLYQYQWHFDNPVYGGIKMEQAWDISTGNSGVVVAVLDTGVAYEDYPTDKCWHLDTYNAYSGYSWWCGQNNPNWAVPPGYSNYWDQYLIHEFDLTSAIGSVTLSFRHKYDTENLYDYGYLEVSDNDGASWTELATYTGNSHAWKRVRNLDITAYRGETILLRFRFNSDYSYSDGDGYYNSDGAWYIDEVEIEDGSGTLFSDDMESGAGGWQVDSLSFQQAPDLVNSNFVAGYDFIDDDPHPNDDDSHGTHVAGTIAQSTNNSLGVAGIAFNTSIMPVKVLGPAGGTNQQVADGIYYAADNGADIINMSLGGPSPSQTLEDAVAYAYNNGVTVIAACGNSNTSFCDYPAAYDDYVIAVGATQYDESRAPYSNYGSSLDLVAPGGNIGLDQNGDGFVDGVLQNTFGNTLQDWNYYFFQGTSMATPHVSVVAALLLSQNSSRTPDDIKNILQSTVEDKGATGWDQYYGYRLLDAYAALSSSVPAVSITLTTDGLVEFGTVGLGATVDSSSDVQTISVGTGPVNLDVKSTIFSDGSNIWALGSNNGIDQVKWEFAPDISTWSTFFTPDTLYDLANNVTEGATQDLYLRLTLPNESSSSNQHSATVTIIATAP